MGDANFDLRRFGVAADVYRCGGHTPGSLAVHAPCTGDLLAADLLAGGIGIGGIARHGRVIESAFHEDRACVVRAVAKLLAWVASVPSWLPRFIGALEVLGAMGLILPFALRVAPRLTPLAAALLAGLMLAALGLHWSRGELALGVPAVALLCLCVFVAIGRGRVRVEGKPWDRAPSPSEAGK